MVTAAGSWSWVLSGPSGAFEVVRGPGVQEPATPVGSSGDVPKALCASWLLLSPVAVGSETAGLSIPMAAGAVLGAPTCGSNLLPF